MSERDRFDVGKRVRVLKDRQGSRVNKNGEIISIIDIGLTGRQLKVKLDDNGGTVVTTIEGDRVQLI